MKKKIYISLILVAAIAFAVSLLAPKNVDVPQQNGEIESQAEREIRQEAQQLQSQTIDPLENAKSRITKKPFGILINTRTSPVQPERFSGYHNAVDLETTPEEKNVDVQVLALCDGKLLSARTAGGYGGVVVQSCNLDGEAVTVIYGHIRLSSVKPKVGDKLKAGDFLANLGTGFSRETDGERKHLHLGIHKGVGINISGYVKTKNELLTWIDPQKHLN